MKSNSKQPSNNSNLAEERKVLAILKNKYPTKSRRKQLGIKGYLTWMEKVFMVGLVVTTLWLSLSYWFSKHFRTKQARLQFIEIWVLGRLLTLLLILFFHVKIYTCHVFIQVIFKIFVIWIIASSLLCPLRILFVDRYTKKPWKPHSFNRSLILLLVNYLEIVTGFAYMYVHYGLVGHSSCSNPITNTLEALYFSMVTITTLGYGDIHPFSSWGYVCSIIEPLMGIILLVVVIGLFFVEHSRQQTYNSETISKSE